jgi:hypothetical protein
MKKNIILFLFVMAFAFHSFSQIPNSGFENWTTVGSYKNPDGWGTMNNTTALAGIYTATQAAPGNPGSYYIKLTSKTISSVVVNGIAVSGKLDSLTQKPISGFAYNQRPQSLTGSWQHMIYGSSQGSVYAVLTRWNSGTSGRDTIAVASQTLSGMAMSWATFTINFTYRSGNYPDSCIIILKASGSAPTANDYLWVDNLAFAGSVAAVPEVSDPGPAFEIYPNPAKDFINIHFDKKSNNDVFLNIYSSSGELVISEKLLSDHQQLNVRDLKRGVYFVEIRSNEQSETQKVILSSNNIHK